MPRVLLAMTLAADLERLQALHAAGALTDTEFAAAKRAAFQDAQQTAAEQAAQPAASLEKQLETLQLEAQVARADRDWLETRRTFVSSTSERNELEPSALGSLLVGGVVAAFGFAWYVSLSAAPELSQLGSPSSHLGRHPASIGLFIAGVGLLTGVAGCIRGCQFAAARQRHEQRRNRLLVKIQQAEAARRT